MIKKVLLTITCGITAISMCACASGSAILNQAQNIVAENQEEIQSYVPNELADVLYGNQQSASGTEETEAAVEEAGQIALADTEDADAPVEETEAA